MILKKITKFDETMVRALVRKLPEDLRSFVLMRYWEQRTIADIAATLRVSVAEVEMGLSQAKKRIEALCLEQPNFSFSTSYKPRGHVPLFSVSLKNFVSLYDS